MRTTKIWILAYAMLAALSLASCRQSAQKTEMERQASSTEVSANADTLHYGLVLCNVYKRGIQKVEFTTKKK